MRCSFLPACVAVVSFLGAACGQRGSELGSASSAEATGTSSQGIQGGVTDTTHKFAMGICIGGRNSNGPNGCQGYCSGALIAPNVVVTARHCVDFAPKT